MEHEQIQSMLSDYLEGSLRDEQAQSLEQHLKSCSTCTADLELLKKALKLVHQIPPVEAPPDFSSRVKRRARKAGLFSTKRRRQGPQMVPFEAIMAVLLAAMGALVIFLLVFFNQLQTLEIEQRPVAILVKTNPEVNLLARAAWEVNGEVWTIGKQVPRGEQLGVSPELELILPPGSWAAFLKTLGPDAVQALPREPPAKGKDGKLHVIVQRTARVGPGDGG